MGVGLSFGTVKTPTTATQLMQVSRKVIVPTGRSLGVFQTVFKTFFQFVRVRSSHYLRIFLTATISNI